LLLIDSPQVQEADEEECNAFPDFEEERLPVFVRM